MAPKDVSSNLIRPSVKTFDSPLNWELIYWSTLVSNIDSLGFEFRPSLTLYSNGLVGIGNVEFQSDMEEWMFDGIWPGQTRCFAPVTT